MQSLENNREIKHSGHVLNNSSFFSFTSLLSNTDIASYTIILFSVLLGFWFRIKGLGTWPLAVDEYYIVKSVENILKYGLPQFDSGGYYVRGIIYQYITAGFILTGMKIEFAARLFPVIANMLVIPPLYILGKKLSGKLFAAILIAVFCFSVWEIEMARFARMYAPFQAIFIWYMLCLYDYVIENNYSRKKWVYILSFLSVFLHEASIFLVVLNFTPLLWRKKFKITDIFLCTLLLAFAYFYLTFNFRTYNNTPYLPPDVSIPHFHDSVVNLPRIMLIYVPQNIFSMGIFLVTAILSVYSILYVFIKLNESILTKSSYSLLIILSLLNLFAFVVFISFIFSTLNWISLKQIKERPVKIISLALIVNFIFWTGFTLIRMRGEYKNAGILEPVKETIKILFKYPNFDVLTIYLHTIPLFTIMAALLLALSLLTIILKKDSKDSEKRFIFFVILSTILMVTLISISYNETRYTFFLFPLVLLLILAEIENLSNFLIGRKYYRQWIFILPVFIFLTISEDFSLHHIIKIDSKEINYRVGFKDNLAYHYYLRWDERTPAEIINKNFKNGDIVISDSPISEFYLKHIDYYYNDYRGRNFPNISIYRGTRDRWSNAKLIYRNSDLLKMINTRKHTIWLIVDNNMYLNEISFYNTYKKNLYYSTIEGKLGLYKFPVTAQNN